MTRKINYHHDNRPAVEGRFAGAICMCNKCQNKRDREAALNGYRWLENGEIMETGDEYSTTRPLPSDPNDTRAEWQPIPDHNVGKAYFDFEFKGTRRRNISSRDFNELKGRSRDENDSSAG